MQAQMTFDALKAAVGEGVVDTVRLVTHDTRYPVEGPQCIENRSSDSSRTVGFELYAAFEVVTVNRIHKAEDPCRVEVIQLYVLRKLHQDTLGDVTDQR